MWWQPQWVLAAICVAVEFKSSASFHVQKPEKDQELQKKAETSGEKKGKAKVQWFTAVDESCDDKCEAEGKECDERALRATNRDFEVREVGVETGAVCDEAYPYLTMNFPSIIGSKQCTKTMPSAGNTCGMSPITSEIKRFCPCGNPNAYGDPHLTNIHGESFDVVREGINTLLLLPKKAEESQKTTLRVDASIEHPGNGSKCGGYFIVRLWIKGTLVGEDVEVSTNGWDLEGHDNLAIKIGSKTFSNQADLANLVTNGKYSLTLDDERNDKIGQHLNNRLKFASLTVHLEGVDLMVDWSTGKNKPNSLGFRATHLNELGTEWGGLLGADDHNWVSTFDPECKKTENYEQVAQLLHVEHKGLWSASASLL